jgi:hypothetical protein
MTVRLRRLCWAIGTTVPNRLWMATILPKTERNVKEDTQQGVLSRFHLSRPGHTRRDSVTMLFCRMLFCRMLFRRKLFRRKLFRRKLFRRKLFRRNDR